MSRRTRRASRALEISLIALVAAACGQLFVDGRNLDGSTWRAVEVAGEPPVAGDEPTLQISHALVNGNAGCTGYSSHGPPSIVNGSIELGEVEITLAGCRGCLGDIEVRFHAALTAAQRIGFRGDLLVLAGPKGEIVFERTK